jgi:hypothetical protein
MLFLHKLYLNFMFKYSVIASVLLILVPWTLVGQHNDVSLINKEARKLWKDSTVVILKNFHPDKAQEPTSVEVKEFDNSRILSVRVTGNAFIPMDRGKWVYIVSVSSHDSPETGDLSLAIDHRGNIWLNEGHVCGGIIHFETNRLKSLSNSRQFFRYFVSDTDSSPWIRAK